MNLILLNELKLRSTKVRDAWIKHSEISDEAYFERLDAEFLALAVKRKIPLEKEAIILAKERGFWTDANQRDLDSSEAYLVRLRESYEKVIESQKKYILEDLNLVIEKVDKLRNQRSGAVGKTAESWAAKLSGERYVQSLFYKDEALSEKLWSEEDLEFTSESEINQLFRDYTEYKRKFKDEALKELACSAFCQNLYCISNGGCNFFGGTVMSMTCLQQRFVLFMENYKNIVSNINGKVSQSTLSDWRELDKWANASERSREEMEKNWSGVNKGGDSKINYESIRKSSMTENRDGEIKSMQNLLS